MSESVLSQIAALREMNTPQLQSRWKELFGAAPQQSNKNYLQRKLAYRMHPKTLRIVDLMKPFSEVWEEQRKRFGF